MNGLVQTTLSNTISRLLEKTVEKGDATPVGCLYFLCSLAWGWARRVGLSSNDFLEVARRQAVANEALEAKALSVDPTRPKVIT